MTGPDENQGIAENQQTVEALAATVMRSHAHAMEALAADVHPHSAQAIRDNEAELELALRDLVAQAEQGRVDAERAAILSSAVGRARMILNDASKETTALIDDALARLDGAR